MAVVGTMQVRGLASTALSTRRGKSTSVRSRIAQTKKSVVAARVGRCPANAKAETETETEEKKKSADVAFNAVERVVKGMGVAALSAALLLSQVDAAEAARGGGRMGGRSFSGARASRSYSRGASPSQSYRGGGGIGMAPVVPIYPGYGMGYGFGFPMFGFGFGGMGFLFQLFIVMSIFNAVSNAIRDSMEQSDDEEDWRNPKDDDKDFFD